MAKDAQTKGRKENGAQPLGERRGLVSDAGIRRTAEAELKSAGPDGPDAKYVGEALKNGPGPGKRPSKT